MDWSEWIISNRQKMRWSREQLAELLGVSKFTVRGWEEGTSRPNPRGKMRLKQTFGELPE